MSNSIEGRLSKLESALANQPPPDSVKVIRMRAIPGQSSEPRIVRAPNPTESGAQWLRIVPS